MLTLKACARLLGATGILLSSSLTAARAGDDSASAYKAAMDYLKGEILPPKAEISYDGPPIKVRFTTFTPENAAIVSDVIRLAFERLSAESDGKLIGEIYWNASAHGARDGFKAVRSGISDLSNCYVAYNPSAFEMFHALGLPGILPDSPVGSLVAANVYQKFLKDEYERQGVYLGRITMTPQYNLVTKAPVDSIEDLQGMSFRSGGGMQSRVIEALGAVPVSVPVSEAYTAFQRGTVDGVMSHDAGFVSFRTGELAKYHLQLLMGGVSTEYCVRQEFFDDLPADLQGVFADWLQRWAMVEAIYYFEQGAEQARSKLAEWGVEFVTLDEQGESNRRKISDIVVETFVEEQQERGMPAGELVTELRRLSDKYARMSWKELLLQSISDPVRVLDVASSN